MGKSTMKMLVLNKISVKKLQKHVKIMGLFYINVFYF